MDETVTSELHKKRNKILGKYAEHSFSAALDEINETLEQEKNHAQKLALLSAKSWILRNKLYCLLYTSPSPRDATLSRMPSSA